jgi:hypothetical protein
MKDFDGEMDDETNFVMEGLADLMISAKEKDMDPIQISIISSKMMTSAMIGTLETAEKDKEFWFDLEPLARFIAEDLKKMAQRLEQLANRVEFS